MNFAYVVTSYRDPPQIYRLAERMRRSSPSARIIVSHDAKGPRLDVDLLGASSIELVRTPGPVTWGDESYLLSILHVLQNLHLGPNDWMTLLTAQDYPLKPLHLYERHLSVLDADALLETSYADDPLLDRYRRRAIKMPRWTASRGRYARAINLIPGVTFHLQPHGARPKIEAPRTGRRALGTLELHRGCDLYALNHRAVDALLRAPQGLLKYFVATSIPSEGFPHTVLRNHPGVTVHDEQIHFMKWRAAAHPDYLVTADLDALSATSAWFARKFKADDPALDVLDAWVDGAAPVG